MTKEELNNLLSEYGVETIPKGLARAILDQVVTEKKAAISEAVENAKQEVIATYKDYKKPEDYQALENEIATMKDATNKASRESKYKALGLKEKYFHLAEQYKDSQDLDKDLAKFKEDNPELFDSQPQPNPQPQPTPTKFGAQAGKSETKTMDDVEKAFYDLNPELKK